MNEKESPFSLFSFSNKPSKDPIPQSKPVFQPVKKTSSAIPVYDPATQEIFDQISGMQADLKAKVDDLAKKSGMSKEEIVQKIRNGAKLDLDRMNGELKMFADKVWDTVGRDIASKSASEPKATLTEKDRKAKTLGARKNWLRMP